MAHGFCWGCYRLLSLACVCSFHPTSSCKNYLQDGFGPCVLETLNVHFENRVADKPPFARSRPLTSSWEDISFLFPSFRLTLGLLLFLIRFLNYFFPSSCELSGSPVSCV